MEMELKRLEEEIFSLGKDFSDNLRDQMTSHQHLHLKECFEANEYGEALFFLDELLVGKALDLDKEAAIQLDNIRHLKRKIQELFNQSCAPSR